VKSLAFANAQRLADFHDHQRAWRVGVSPRRLELEITENVLMHDTDVNIATLHRLRNLGVRISLDDFGTGYSSLNYLAQLPLRQDQDRSLFHRVDRHQRRLPGHRRLGAGLASDSAMITTAEGVERPSNWPNWPAEAARRRRASCSARRSIRSLTDLRSRSELSAGIWKRRMSSRRRRSKQ